MATLSVQQKIIFRLTAKLPPLNLIWRYSPGIVLVLFLLVFVGNGAPASTKTFRLMTYNIHVGIGMDQKVDLQRIADVINEQHPDLVGLQEVDRGVRRTQGIDEIAELAQMTKMNFAFAHNLDFEGGQYGVAILSRSSIDLIDHRKFENRREAERRGMLRVEVEIAGRKLNFVTTHLDYQYTDGRLFETEQLFSNLADVKGPILVVGDFNDESTGGAYKLMTTKFQDAWLDSKPKTLGFSYPSDKLAKRIDYIFYRPSDGIRVKKAWTVQSLASDHVPVVAELTIK
jgi:endonuclease/exonuclease/phosphatase family metal-dependent hydrolase